MRIVRIVLFAALLPVPVAAPVLGASSPEAHTWCGTGGETSEIALARHLSARQRAGSLKRSGRVPAKSNHEIFSVGQIVVLNDDFSSVLPPNTFDLQDESMQYLRRGGGRTMSVVRAPVGFIETLVDKLSLGDDDTELVVFPDDFRFPFGDRVYDRVWVNSDGNLTFGESDIASTARDLTRFLNGPPRVAPLFVDLDPSQATGENGVYLQFLTNRVRLTWWNVPEFRDPASTDPVTSSTFQVTLFSNGRIVFAYGDVVEAKTPIVGVSPFGGGDVRVVDYDADLPFPPAPSAVAEQFSEDSVVDQLNVAARFLEEYRDLYDTIVIWYDFFHHIDGDPGIIARRFSIQNDVVGIHSDLFDFSSFFGAENHRLSGVIEMGRVSRYPEDPDDPSVGGLDQTASIQILGHEFGHRWMARVDVLDQGAASDLLLGRARGHWSAHMHAMGSLLEGNFLVDNGDGTFTATADHTKRYSTLDQYLMGLINPGAVEDFFVLKGVTNPDRDTAAPSSGITLIGTRVDVKVEDVIAVEGRRAPGVARSRKDFRTGFIIVGEPGEPVSQATIDKVERLRRRWLTFFREATDDRGTMATALFPR